MDETTTLGAYLRAERERRDLALRTISESTKVSLPLLEGLESDDISRWPGGIFRRAFVRSYAEAVGLDPDEVFQRFERQYKPASDTAGMDTGQQPTREIVALAQASGVSQGSARTPVESGSNSGNRRGSDRRAGAGLRQRGRGVATALAGAPHRRLLRRRRALDRNQPDGRPHRRAVVLQAVSEAATRDFARSGQRRKRRIPARALVAQRDFLTVRCLHVVPLLGALSWCRLSHSRVRVGQLLASLCRDTRRTDL